MRIRISDQEIVNVGILSSGNVTGWDGWRARQRCSRLWSWLSVSVRWSCTCSFGSPACLRILYGSIVAREAAGHVVLTKHCRVALERSLQRFMPRKLNTPHLLCSDLGAGCLNVIFYISSIVAQEKPSLDILAIFNARLMSDC
jgi:hypothetical protein